MECPFCRLKPERILEENSDCIMVRDAYPVSRGHTLIISRHHVQSFFDLTAHERQSLLELIDLAKSQLDGEYAPDGYNIGINDGAAAGQTVPHLHVHVIPRYRGDRDDPRGGVRWVLPEKAAYWDK